MHTNIFNKTEQKCCGDCSPYFCNWSHGLHLDSSSTYFIFLPPSVSTSEGLRSLLGRVTEPWLLKIMDYLSSCLIRLHSFPLTLITGCSSTKRCPEGSLLFVHTHTLPHHPGYCHFVGTGILFIVHQKKGAKLHGTGEKEDGKTVCQPKKGFYSGPRRKVTLLR